MSLDSRIFKADTERAEIKRRAEAGEPAAIIAEQKLRAAEVDLKRRIHELLCSAQSAPPPTDPTIA